MTLAITLVLAVLVGTCLGLLGGGGSILTVPLLVWVAGQPPRAAIATSLLVVAVTAVAGVVSHARAGRVQWRTGLAFGSAGMAGAYLGGRLAGLVPGVVLLVAFGVMMAVTAAAMLRIRPAPAPPLRVRAPAVRIVVQGLAVGVATGLVGAGGGFLVVPALVLLAGLPMASAVGTSLLVIAMQSTAGLAGHLASAQVDWRLAAGVAGAAVIGSLVGNRLVGRIDGELLRRGFGWFVAAMAVAMVGTQLDGLLAGQLAAGAELATTTVGAWSLLAVGLGVVAVATAAVVDLRRRARDLAT